MKLNIRLPGNMEAIETPTSGVVLWCSTCAMEIDKFYNATAGEIKKEASKHVGGSNIK
ncbi:MAG: hypothetical protein ACTSYA_02330 [Candidatus Kariarchaeaceae archaeon]